MSGLTLYREMPPTAVLETGKPWPTGYEQKIAQGKVFRIIDSRIETDAMPSTCCCLEVLKSLVACRFKDERPLSPPHTTQKSGVFDPIETRKLFKEDFPFMEGKTRTANFQGLKTRSDLQETHIVQSKTGVFYQYCLMRGAQLGDTYVITAVNDDRNEPKQVAPWASIDEFSLYHCQGGFESDGTAKTLPQIAGEVESIVRQYTPRNQRGTGPLDLETGFIKCDQYAPMSIHRVVADDDENLSRFTDKDSDV